MTRTDTTAQQLQAALAEQESLYQRSTMVDYLLGRCNGVFSTQQVRAGAKAGASRVVAAKVDKLASLQDEIASLQAADRADIEGTVDKLTHQLLAELGFKPRASRYKWRRPAWTCTVPHEDYGHRDVTVISITHLRLDKAQGVSSLQARVSEHDNGCTDSLTLGRPHGDLVALRPCDF